MRITSRQFRSPSVVAAAVALSLIGCVGALVPTMRLSETNRREVRQNVQVYMGRNSTRRPSSGSVSRLPSPARTSSGTRRRRGTRSTSFFTRLRWQAAPGLLTLRVRARGRTSPRTAGAPTHAEPRSSVSLARALLTVAPGRLGHRALGWRSPRKGIQRSCRAPPLPRLSGRRPRMRIDEVTSGRISSQSRQKVTMSAFVIYPSTLAWLAMLACSRLAK